MDRKSLESISSQDVADARQDLALPPAIASSPIMLCSMVSVGVHVFWGDRIGKRLSILGWGAASRPRT